MRKLLFLSFLVLVLGCELADGESPPDLIDEIDAMGILSHAPVDQTGEVENDTGGKRTFPPGTFTCSNVGSACHITYTNKKGDTVTAVWRANSSCAIDTNGDWYCRPF